MLWINSQPVGYTHFTWAPLTLEVLRARVGDCRGQTCFEFATLLIVAVAFEDTLTSTGACIMGDNLGALNDALNLKSTVPSMNAVARELAWRRIARRWHYELAHLPKERNDEADALSRLQAVPAREVPMNLHGSRYYQPPEQTTELWKARLVYN